MSASTVIASRTFKRSCGDHGGLGHGYLVVEAKLYSLGEQAPYFSVTAELWQSAGWYRNGQDGRMIAGGQLHEYVLAVFPSLAPVVALHLANEDGEPLHAVENGWYWYSDYNGKGTSVGGDSAFARMSPHERAADYLRVEPGELPEGLDREAFAEYVDGLRPRWKQEAAVALAYLREQETKAVRA